MSLETAALFNGAISASAIAAACDVGLLDRVERAGSVALGRFCREAALHERSIDAVVHVLVVAGILEWDDRHDRVTPGPLFAEVVAETGYFVWLVRGYGYLLQHLGELCRLEPHGSARDPACVRRDGRQIAIAGRNYGARFVDPYVSAALEAHPFAVVADLGCGSAARLIDLVRARPAIRGVGVDCNPEAVAVARQHVRAAGLGDRITIVEEDVRRLSSRAEYRDADLLLSFFMGHDLWPREACCRVFARIRQVFPAVARFLLCDTYRPESTPVGAAPIFQLGFDLTHAVMGQDIPSQADWRGLFADCGWTCGAVQPIGIPSSAIFDLAPVRAGVRQSVPASEAVLIS